MGLPHWYGKIEDDVLELKIPTKGVLLVLLSSESKHASVAAILNHLEIIHLNQNQASFKSWMQSILHLLKSETVFRLIGNSEEFATLTAALVGVNLKEGKHVSRDVNEPTLVHFLPKEGRIRIPKTESSNAGNALDVGHSADIGHSVPKTRVLIVDDSDTIRKLLTRIINEDPQMECVAAVPSPNFAMDAIEKFKPDVITLDIHMPEMDGVTLLKKILLKFPIPTVMISALSKEDGTFVLDALEAGAVDYIQKPSFEEVKSAAPMICERIKNARFAKVKVKDQTPHGSAAPLFALSSEDVDFSYLIAIGSSTGGTEALKVVLTQLPEKIPPILIVQHIPPVFSKAFADRINGLCPFEVKEAEHGEEVTVNKVLIAPGGKHMKVRSSSKSSELRIEIDDSPSPHRHRPSVDVLFDSIVELKRKKICAAILTGMGTDGAAGLLKLKNMGAHTLAQDEATSVVFGMPREALKLGGAEEAVPIEKIAGRILRNCRRVKKVDAA